MIQAGTDGFLKLAEISSNGGCFVDSKGKDDLQDYLEMSDNCSFHSSPFALIDPKEKSYSQC